MPTAPQLGFDLAIDASGANAPSRVAAGLDMPGASDPTVMAALRWFAAVAFVTVRYRRHLRPDRSSPDRLRVAEPA